MSAFKLDSEASNLVKNLINYASSKNLSFLHANSINGLYTTTLSENNNFSKSIAILHTYSHHFNDSASMIAWFYRFFGHPNIHVFTHIAPHTSITGLPSSLTPSLIRKHYPYNDPIRATGRMAQKRIQSNSTKSLSHTPHKIYLLNSLQVDILDIHHPSDSFPVAYGGFKHALIAVDLCTRYTIAFLLKSKKSLRKPLSLLYNAYSAVSRPITSTYYAT
jgi:hypothetical protein